MDISKVVYGDTTLIDLTEDTVTADSMLSGVTAHGANGEQIYGTMSQVTPATAAPLMDGTAAVGVSIKYAREDHVHPHDSSIPTKVSDLTNDSGFIAAPSANVDEVIAYNGTTWVADKRMVILSYGSSTWTDFINAYNSNAVVYCRASSNSNPASGAQTRMAFMAYVNASPPTNVEFQYYRSVSSHTDSQQGDQVFIYKLDKTAGWSVTTRNTFTKVVAGTGLGSSYSNGTITMSLESEYGIPSGGTAGQVLAKNSNTDRDVTWVDQSSGSSLPTSWQSSVASRTDEYNDSGSYYAAYWSLYSIDQAFEVGDSVSVTWDGVAYTCVAFNLYDYATIGSKSILDGQTGDYPFCIVCRPNLPTNYDFEADTLSTASTHTLSMIITHIYRDDTPLAMKSGDWAASNRTLLPQVSYYTQLWQDSTSQVFDQVSNTYWHWHADGLGLMPVDLKEGDPVTIDIYRGYIWTEPKTFALRKGANGIFYVGNPDVIDTSKSGIFGFYLTLENDVTDDYCVKINYYDRDDMGSGTGYVYDISVGTPDDTILVAVDGEWKTTLFTNIVSPMTTAQIAAAVQSGWV